MVPLDFLACATLKDDAFRSLVVITCPDKAHSILFYSLASPEFSIYFFEIIVSNKAKVKVRNFHLSEWKVNKNIMKMSQNGKLVN